jgi:hypothetical protein
VLFTEKSDDEVEGVDSAESGNREPEPHNHTLQLRRWGRIEGVLRRGNAPLPNETISYARLSSLGNLLVEELPGVYFNDYATTGADGSFTFERVPPGVNQVCLTICTRLAVNHTIHTGVVAIRTRQSRSHLTSVTVEPGATAKVTIGGTGQPVIGKVDAHEPIDWSGVSASLTYSPVPEKGFQNAKGVLESMSAAREYYVTVDADGNFRAEDVPEGRYKLFISISTGTELRVFTTEPEQIEVPPIDGGRSDEPLDVGLIRVEPRD